jgi:hypothetical protein
MRSLLRFRHGRESFDRAWLTVLYPQLKRMPLESWPHALQRARQTELSAGERAGILAAIGFSAYLLQPLGDPAAGLVVRALEQFLLALPAVALLASPWLVRRTRRGLQREAQRFDGGDPCPESQAPMPPPGIESSRAIQEQTVTPKHRS